MAPTTSQNDADKIIAYMLTGTFPSETGQRDDASNENGDSVDDGTNDDSDNNTSDDEYYSDDYSGCDNNNLYSDIDRTVASYEDYTSDDDIESIIRRRQQYASKEPLDEYFSVRGFDKGWTWRMFWETCYLLRYNDHAIKIVDVATLEDDDPYPFGYGWDLGQALLGNTIVNVLTLDPFTFFKFREDGGFDPNEAKPLLRCIRTSPALRKINLRQSVTSHTRDDRHQLEARRSSAIYLTGQILRIMVENPSIHSFNANVKVPLNEFILLLESISTKTVELNEDALTGFIETVEDSQRVLEAFKSNKTLECINIMFHEATAAIAESIIYQLVHHPTLVNCTLYDMALSRKSSDVNSLVALLQATTVLKVLELCIPLDVDNANLLINGLMANRSVTRLELDLNPLSTEEAAASSLVEFVKHAANQNGNKLSELVVKADDGRAEMNQIMSTMGVGSALETYQRRGRYDFDSSPFLDNLDMKRLRRFCLDESDLYLSEVQSLARFLTETSRLQYVRLTGMRDDEKASQKDTAAVLLPALRCNGSLFVAVFEMWGKKSPSIFTKEQAVLVDAYLERNKNLPKLLAKPERKCERDDASVESDSDDDSENKETQTAIAAAIPEVFPPLFATAQITPRMTPNACLLGLLSLSIADASSPRQGELRSRSL